MKLFMVISERHLEIMHENKKKISSMKKNHSNIFFVKENLIMSFQQSGNPNTYKGFPSSMSSNIACTYLKLCGKWREGEIATKSHVCAYVQILLDLELGNSYEVQEFPDYEILVIRVSFQEYETTIIIKVIIFEIQFLFHHILFF